MTLCQRNWKASHDCPGCDRHGPGGYVKCTVCGVEVQEISKDTDHEFARCKAHSETGKVKAEQQKEKFKQFLEKKKGGNHE